MKGAAGEMSGRWIKSWPRRRSTSQNIIPGNSWLLGTAAGAMI